MGKIKKCIVPYCNNIKSDKISLHYFPTNVHFKEQWLRALKMRVYFKWMQVCSEHFCPENFYSPEVETLRRALRKDAVPTRNLPVTLITEKKNSAQVKARASRTTRRVEQKLQLINSPTHDINTEEAEIPLKPNVLDSDHLEPLTENMGPNLQRREEMQAGTFTIESDPLAITPADNLALFAGSMENIEFVVESDEEDNEFEIQNEEFIVETDDLEEQDIEIMNEKQVLNVPCVTLSDNQIIDLDAAEIKEEIEISEEDIKPIRSYRHQYEELEAVNRDGVQKNRCYVPGCTSVYTRPNFQNNEDIYWFSVPVDENLKKIWNVCIGRVDKVLSHGDAVCHKHFAEEDLIRQYTISGSDGKIIVPYKKPKLRQGAVPCVRFYKKCCVPDCGRTSGRMYCFPVLHSSDLRLWIYMIKNPALKNLTNQEILRYRVCNIHFDSDCFEDDSSLKRTAAPTLYLPDTVDLARAPTPPEAKAVNSAQSNIILICAYGECLSRSNAGKNLFRFPTVAERCIAWLKVCGRRNLITTPKETLKHMKYLKLGVCEDHFDLEDFVSITKDVLKPDAIPKPYRELNMDSRRQRDISTKENKSVSRPLRASNVPVKVVERNDIPKTSNVKHFSGVCACGSCQPSADNSRFPADTERSEKWLRASGLFKGKQYVTKMQMCGKPFDKNMFLASNKLKPDAVSIKYNLYKQIEDGNETEDVNSSTSVEPNADDTTERQSTESKHKNIIHCAVENCLSFYDAKYNRASNIKFPHPILEPDRFNIWLRLIANPKLRDLSPEEICSKYTVCERHFERYFSQKGKKVTQLSPEAVPTKNLTADSEWFITSEYCKTRLQNYIENLNIKDISEEAPIEWIEDDVLDIEEFDDKTRCVLEQDRIRFPGMGYYLYMGKRVNTKKRKVPYNVYNCFNTGYGLNNDVEFGESIRIHTAIIIDDDDDCERQVLQQLLDKRRKSS